jgi:integrase/recombinase XerD
MIVENTETFENEELIENLSFAETVAIHNTLSENEPAANAAGLITSPTGGRRKGALKPKGQVDFLDRNKADLMLANLKNLKHRTAILIMMDCGLRVSECISLQVKNFDFRKKTLKVKSLKKKGEELIREIPMSTRLLETLADYVKQINPKTEEDYLFTGTGGNQHISRKAFNKVCEVLKKNNPQLGNLHPHTLRHTFATQMLASGTALHNVSEMLGHANYNTTLIYNHTPIEILRQNIDAATAERLNWYQRFYRKLFPKKTSQIINLSTNPNNFLIGRDSELIQVMECINKNINTILLGNIGIGKSHILKQIQIPNKKTLLIDEMGNLKMTFVNMLLYLYDNDKQAIKSMIFGDFDKAQIQQKLQKDSVQTLIEEIIKITAKHEYVLVIDNVDGITTKAMKCIELLKDHFTIITTARTVAINKANFLWNFERIEIQPLPRAAALELIHRLSYDIDVEDFEMYRNHIHDQSAGNPRVIFEMCERYRKEMIVTDDVVRSVRHIGGLPEIDMSFIIVIILAGVSILRYTSREVGGTNFRFIGGMALVLLFLVRFFLSKTKRRFI